MKEPICHLHINARTLETCESCREKVRKMSIPEKLKEITDIELTAEINRRRQARIEAERKARVEKNGHIASLVAAAGASLVDFAAPTHRKGAQCNDESHWNGYSGECARCTLLDIVAGDTPSESIALGMEITVRKVEKKVE